MTNAHEQVPAASPSAEERTLTAVPLVHRIVREISARVPSCVDRDELLSAGLVAALEAARAYRPDADGDFLRYADAVVRSEILVVLRATDITGPRPEPTVDAVIADARLLDLRVALDSLEERHRLVLDGYFVGERDADGIAVELGLAEAQVVRLRTEALMLLRDTLRADAADAVDAAAGGPQEARRAPYAAVAARRLVQASSMPDGNGLPRGAA